MCCGHINHVGFIVPDKIWNKAIPSFFQNSILCLRCFATFADEALIEWEKDIKFYPISLKKHLKQDKASKKVVLKLSKILNNLSK